MPSPEARRLCIPAFLAGVAAAFAPRFNKELKAAIDECTQASSIGECAEPHGAIGVWNVSVITDMEHLFSQAVSFNQDLSAWDVSAVTSMSDMFFLAKRFNQDLSKWDVSSVRHMHDMFYVARSFNQKLSTWDVSGVVNMGYMFAKARMFKQDLSKWDVSAVTDMRRMFYHAPGFGLGSNPNSDLSAWDVSAVKDMRGMFGGARNFNQNLSAWDVSAVTDMRWMFQDARSFNQILCGVSWVNSKAKNTDILKYTHGSISSTVCTTTSQTIMTMTSTVKSEATTRAVVIAIGTTTAINAKTASVDQLDDYVADIAAPRVFAAFGVTVGLLVLS